MGPGWRQRPRTFAPQASVMAAGVRDDVGHEYTCFMRGGEDARLHGPAGAFAQEYTVMRNTLSDNKLYGHEKASQYCISDLTVL